VRRGAKDHGHRQQHQQQDPLAARQGDERNRGAERQRPLRRWPLEDLRREEQRERDQQRVERLAVD
jgi:hypothetical protein